VRGADRGSGDARQTRAPCLCVTRHLRALLRQGRSHRGA
jgi:hypothetical protein